MARRIKLVACITVIVLAYTFLNIKHYSLYYAERTPHKEGMGPAMFEMVDSLDWISNPDLEGFKYDFDGPRTVVHTGGAIGHTGFVSIQPSDEGTYFQFYDAEQKVLYIFDGDYHFVPEKNEECVDQDGAIDSSYEEAVKKECRENFQSVIDAQPAPFINLQFQYDYINHDRFN